MERKKTHDEDVIAVVGASSDPRKYGYKVYMYLLREGYTVYPIHPDNGTLEGQVRYKTIADTPRTPTLVVTVVPPPVTEHVVRECAQLHIPKVWMQPGSESEEAIQFCKAHSISVTVHACIMLTGA